LASLLGAAAAAGEKKDPPVDLRALFKLHYETRMQSFKEQNQQLRYVVLLGDSITEGFDAPKYFPGRRVLNRGIGGDVIGNALPADDPRGVLRRLDNSVFACAATDVSLLIGINDLGDGLRRPSSRATVICCARSRSGRTLAAQRSTTLL
jgi:hypothetical protein